VAKEDGTRERLRSRPGPVILLYISNHAAVFERPRKALAVWDPRRRV
jgi:hypothetical protein